VIDPKLNINLIDSGESLAAVVGLSKLLNRKPVIIYKYVVNQAAAMDETIDKRLAVFLDEPKFKKVDLGFDKLNYQEIRDLVAAGVDEEVLASNLEQIQSEDLALALSSVVLRAHGYVRDRIPKSTVRFKIEKPSDFQAAEFLRVWKVVSEPLSILDDLEMGCLASSQVATLKAVYPRLLEVMASSMMDAVADKIAADPKYLVPYPKLKQIAILLEQKLVPEDLKGLLQNNFKSGNKEDAAQAQGGQVPDLAKAEATQIQKLDFGL
jgi:hypothetical protein